MLYNEHLVSMSYISILQGQRAIAAKKQKFRKSKSNYDKISQNCNQNEKIELLNTVGILLRWILSNSTGKIKQNEKGRVHLVLRAQNVIQLERKY